MLKCQQLITYSTLNKEENELMKTKEIEWMGYCGFETFS